MIYKWDDIDSVIAILQNTYQVSNGDYIVRLNTWVNTALCELNIKLPYVPKFIDVTVNNDGCFKLPNMKYLYAIYYEGCQINRAKGVQSIPNVGTEYVSYFETSLFVQNTQNNSDGTISKRISEIKINRNHPNSGYYYALLNNSYAETNIPVGKTLTVYYGAIPTNPDVVSGIPMIMVPDNEIVKMYIALYVLTHLLYGGFKHPVQSLTTNNKFTNPAIMMEEYKEKARNQLIIIDAQAREKLKDIATTMIHNTSFASRFNGNYDESN